MFSYPGNDIVLEFVPILAKALSAMVTISLEVKIINNLTGNMLVVLMERKESSSGQYYRQINMFL